jgi:hypothetical protein
MQQCPGCLQRPMEIHGSALRSDLTSAADPGVDRVLSLSGARSSDRVLVPVVESVNEVAVPSSLPALVLRPPVFLSDLPSGVRSPLVSSLSKSGLILRQAGVLPSAVVRSGVEVFQFREIGDSSVSAGLDHVGVAFSAPSGNTMYQTSSLCRQAGMLSDVPALGRSFGGVNLLGLPGVSASIPSCQWVLFPQWPRPVSFVFGYPQLTGLSSRVVEVGESSKGVDPKGSVVGCHPVPGLPSGIIEVGESSKGVDPKDSVVVYPRVVEDSKSWFHTMGVSFVGSDQKGFLDFLALIEDERFDFDSPPKKDKEINRKKGKREVKNLECSINFDARGMGSSRNRGKKMGV